MPTETHASRALNSSWARVGGWGGGLETVLRGRFVSFFEWIGDLGYFCVRVARAVFTTPFEGRELLRQADEVGSKSVPLVALAGAATGIVISLQSRQSLTRFGAKSLLPAVIAYSIIKEILPSTFKTAGFGLIIGTVACFQGFRTRGGTAGVGKAATSSVVIASVLILVADVFLVRLIAFLFP